ANGRGVFARCVELSSRPGASGFPKSTPAIRFLPVRWHSGENCSALFKVLQSSALRFSAEKNRRRHLRRLQRKLAAARGGIRAGSERAEIAAKRPVSLVARGTACVVFAPLAAARNRRRASARAQLSGKI